MSAATFFISVYFCLEKNFQQDKCEDIINNMIKCCMQNEVMRSLPQCSGLLKDFKMQQKEEK